MKFGFAVVLLFLSTLLFCISLKLSSVVKENPLKNSIWANDSGVTFLGGFGDDLQSSLESSEQDALGDVLGAL